MIQLSFCPICNFPITKAQKIYTRTADSIFKCEKCKSLFSNPQYSFEELDVLYKENYWESDTSMGSYQIEEHRRNKLIYHKMLNNIKKRYYSKFPLNTSIPPKLLDFGCGPGYFLYESKKYGFEPLGIELSIPALDFARKQYDLNVIEGSEKELANFPDNYFDIITCWSVLEHLSNPRKLLSEFNRVLKPGGFLCVSIPNINCYEHKLKKGNWYNIQNPAHVVFLQEHSLKQLLKETGFNNFYRPIFFGGFKMKLHKNY